MRAYEFLIEYNRTKVFNDVGGKLLSVILADRGNLPPDLKALVADYRVTQELDIKTAIIDDVLNKIEDIDPTNNKEYVPWITKQYNSGTIQFEDLISQGADGLAIYHKAKVKKLLKPSQRDIMAMAFSQMIEISSDQQIRMKLQPKQSNDRGAYSVILDNDQVRIIQPKDLAASKFWGQNTKWCTAAEKNNMFETYAAEGPIYVIIPKTPSFPGEKYQISFRSNEFKDKENNDIQNLQYFLTEQFGDLTTLFEKLEPGIISKLVFMADPKVIHHIVSEAFDIYYDELHEYIRNTYFGKYPKTLELRKYEKLLDGFYNQLDDDTIINGSGTYVDQLPSDIFTKLLPNYYKKIGMANKDVLIAVEELADLFPVKFNIFAMQNKKGIYQVEFESSIVKDDDNNEDGYY